MRLYTARGDQGETDLLGERVVKDDPRVDLIGDLDEATSAIGLARASIASERVKGLLVDVQRDLYRVMADLAFVTEVKPERAVVTEEVVARIGELTDGLAGEIELPRQFILPGETVGSAALDVARAVIRRSERLAVTLTNAGVVENPQIVAYLNRLSSLLFIAARFVEAELGLIPLKAKTTAP